jgi:SAM-dependent methyltransferase
VGSGEGLVDFYERSYSTDPTSAERGGRWRALGARTKADHVIGLCAAAGLAPRTVADVGCGDGALLSELHRRGFGARLAGFEITEAAARLSRGRAGVDSVAVFDGERLPGANLGFDLGILSHVLEHVPEPGALLAETARVCRAVVVEVPLERNLSARRASKRAGAAEVGHLHVLDRPAVAAVVRSAGLRIAGELDDPLPRAVHRFFASGRPSRLRADAKWALRSGLARGAPALARRLFTVHYACLCVPDGPVAAANSSDSAPPSSPSGTAAGSASF